MSIVLYTVYFSLSRISSGSYSKASLLHIGTLPSKLTQNTSLVGLWGFYAVLWLGFETAISLSQFMINLNMLP